MNLNNLTSVIFNDVVNDTQICYHLVYPKNFNLVKKFKRTTQSGAPIISKKRRRRGRPRKEEVKKFEEGRRAPEDSTIDGKPNENAAQLACSRTRSGRVSRPPKHMSKFIDINKEPRVSTAIDTTSAVPMDTNNIQSNFITDQPTADAMNIPNIPPEPKKIRKNVDRFTCAVCKKVYLGRKKLLKHYLTFPDHKTPIASSLAPGQFKTNGLMINGTNHSLFDELMSIVGRASGPERISIFLAEISNFVGKIRLLKSKMLQMDPDSLASTSEYYVDRNVSKVLDLPEGLVHLNNRAFDDNFKQNNIMFRAYIDDRPSADVSVQPTVNNIQPVAYNLNLFPQVNYDHITDNAVEAEALGESTVNAAPESPILDIPLDLFSFNGIK